MLQITRPWKNLLLSINIAKNNNISNVHGDGDCKNKTNKKLLSKNLNGATRYLNLQTSLAFTQLRKTFTEALIL